MGPWTVSHRDSWEEQDVIQGNQLSCCHWYMCFNLTAIPTARKLQPAGDTALPCTDTWILLMHWKLSSQPPDPGWVFTLKERVKLNFQSHLFWGMAQLNILKNCRRCGDLLLSTLWCPNHLQVNHDPFCLLPPHHLLPPLLKHNKLLCRRYRVPLLRYICPCQTLQGAECCAASALPCALFQDQRTNKWLSQTHWTAIILCATGFCPPACCSLPVRAPSPRQDLLSSPCPTLLPQAKPWANRWAWPCLLLPLQATKAEAETLSLKWIGAITGV